MKVLCRVAVALLLAASFATEGYSQSASTERARGLVIKNYENGKTDGMRILIHKVEGATLVPVDPSRTFTKDDEIKVAFESNFDGCVYFINVSPGGKSRVLFPFAGDTDNSIRSRKRYELPNNGVIAFDEEKGVEILQVIMSKDRIRVLDAAIRDANGELGESAASAAAELASAGKPQPSGIVGENVAMVLPKTMRTRGIVLASGKDRDKQGSVVAIPQTKAKDGRLKPGEVAVFEIRLKHV
jgi:hypothetical protein